MKFAVKAIAINPETGTCSDPRVEEIDTVSNRIFRGCDTPWKVEDQYEAYWNRLNDIWEYNFPANKEKVKVLSVEEI